MVISKQWSYLILGSMLSTSVAIGSDTNDIEGKGQGASISR